MEMRNEKREALEWQCIVVLVDIVGVVAVEAYGVIRIRTSSVPFSIGSSTAFEASTASASAEKRRLCCLALIEHT